METLFKLRKKENELAEKQAQAEQEKKELILHAKNNTATIRERARRNANTRNAALFEKAQKEGNTEARKIAARSRREIAALKTKAKKNIAKAANRVLAGVLDV